MGALGLKIEGSEAKIGVYVAKIEASGIKIGASGSKILGQ